MARIPETTDQPTIEAPERTAAMMFVDWGFGDIEIASFFGSTGDLDDSEADCPVDADGFILF